jgi:hypothetical protein
MAVSKSALKMKAMIEKAIEEHKLKRSEYDSIINLATEDGHLDPQEKALFSELQDLIDDRTIRIIPD